MDTPARRPSAAAAAVPGEETTIHGAHAPSPQAGPESARTQKLTQLGDFKLVKKLGAGAMGTVYLAQQLSLDRPAALKVMAKHLTANTDLVQRFQREARLMAKLDHPGIVRCFGVGEEHGFHYLAMEFIDGGSLQSHLKRVGRLSVADALKVTIDVARALQHAHEQGVIHRDLKPDNVLLTKSGQVKLADLGLAKALEEDLGLTASGVGAGTPFYMAPEQAGNAKHADARSDLYSLGCMLYAFLTGQVPFAGETMIEVLKAKEAGRFTPTRRVNDTVPAKVDLILQTLLNPTPNFRFQTAAQLIADLEGLGLAGEQLEFLDGVAPAQPPPSVESQATEAVAGRTAPDVPRKPAAPPPAPPKQETPDVWYVTYTTSEGEMVTRKFTTDQLQRLIRVPDFDPKAQASRTADGELRSLASFKEFQSILQGRLAKENADRKSTKVRSAYEKILDEEVKQKSRKRWRWLKEKVGGGIAMIVVLAILGGALYGAYLFLASTMK